MSKRKWLVLVFMIGITFLLPFAAHAYDIPADADTENPATLFEQKNIVVLECLSVSDVMLYDEKMMDVQETTFRVQEVLRGGLVKVGETITVMEYSGIKKGNVILTGILELKDKPSSFESDIYKQYPEHKYELIFGYSPAVQKSDGHFYIGYNNIGAVSQIKEKLEGKYDETLYAVRIAKKGKAVGYAVYGNDKKALTVNAGDVVLVRGSSYLINGKSYVDVLYNEVSCGVLAEEYLSKDRKAVPEKATVKVVGTSAYIYSKTNTSSKKIGVARKYSKIAVISETKSFYKVQTGSGVGYVLKTKLVL